jgi:integrase
MAVQRAKAKSRRRHNGDGTISGPRKDGRYVGAFYAPSSAGSRKRFYVYGKTWEEARDKLIEEQAKIVRGIPVATESWRLGPYLDHWLETVVKQTRRPATYANYETYIRLYLKPELGSYRLRRLSVANVQQFLNGKLAEGQSVRNVQIMRQVLSAALTRATREELVSRNVARLVELPTWEPREVQPWSADEAMAFLAAAKTEPLHPAFVLLLLYGMRRGEVLGLRWLDVDLAAGKVHVLQQLQRIRGSLHTGPVKTRAGNRDLPIPAIARAALLARQAKQAADREAFGAAWQDTGLVFTTRSGRPVEPRNLDRSFLRICEDRKIRVITVHHLRHTTASLLKTLNVPARDTQTILGHSNYSTTMQIYTHVDEVARREALTGLNNLLTGNQ